MIKLLEPISRSPTIPYPDKVVGTFSKSENCIVCRNVLLLSATCNPVEAIATPANTSLYVVEIVPLSCT